MAVTMNGEFDAVLDNVGRRGPLDVVTVRLFVNNLVPAVTDNVGMYVEATFAGYAGQVVTPWGAPSGGSGGTSSAPFSPAVFAPGVLGSPQDCYGWYMTDALGALIAADVFAGGPLNLGGTVTSVTITPSALLT